MSPAPCAIGATRNISFPDSLVAPFVTGSCTPRWSICSSCWPSSLSSALIENLCTESSAVVKPSLRKAVSGGS